jgi:hypothetical protein
MSLFQTIRLLFCFFFGKRKFVQLDLRRIIKANLESNLQFKAMYPNKESIPEEYITEWTASSGEKMSVLRKAIYRSFLIGFFILVLCAALTAVFYPNKWPPKLSTDFGLLSTFLILWSTYGQLGWEIQSGEGNTYVEKINLYWFRIVFGCGMFFLFMALFIS